MQQIVRGREVDAALASRGVGDGTVSVPVVVKDWNLLNPNDLREQATGRIERAPLFPSVWLALGRRSTKDTEQQDCRTIADYTLPFHTLILGGADMVSLAVSIIALFFLLYFGAIALGVLMGITQSKKPSPRVYPHDPRYCKLCLGGGHRVA